MWGGGGFVETDFAFSALLSSRRSRTLITLPVPRTVYLQGVYGVNTAMHQAKLNRKSKTHHAVSILMETRFIHTAHRCVGANCREPTFTEGACGTKRAEP